jgi:hypothetical protein
LLVKGPENEKECDKEKQGQKGNNNYYLSVNGGT